MPGEKNEVGGGAQMPHVLPLTSNLYKEASIQPIVYHPNPPPTHPKATRTRIKRFRKRRMKITQIHDSTK